MNTNSSTVAKPSNPLLEKQNSLFGETPVLLLNNKSLQQSPILDRNLLPPPPAKKPKKPNKLKINVSYSKYEVVRNVAANVFQMKVQEEESDQFDVFWCDGAIAPEKLQRLKPYQRLNHFPGMQALARKNNLGKNLLKMKKKFPGEYDFFPETWMLPGDAAEFR